MDGVEKLQNDDGEGQEQERETEADQREKQPRQMIEVKSSRNQKRQGKTAADQQGNASHKTQNAMIYK